MKYRDHIGYNTSKVISPLVSLGCSLFANPNTVDLLQREHPEFLAGIGVRYGKWLRTKALMGTKVTTEDK